MKKQVLKVSVVFAFILTTATAKAQLFNAPGTQGSGIGIPVAGGTKTPVVPFDGGMSLILAASGISYVCKQLNKKK